MSQSQLHKTRNLWREIHRGIELEGIMQHEKFILKPGDLPPYNLIREDVIIGRSTAASELRQMIELAATANYPVLLTGPIGSGKESVARALQHASRLHDHPFTLLNTNQMSADKFSAALLDKNMSGVRYIADIENLSPALQLDLIKRIDQDTISGHQRSRVIAGTHACLTRMINNGAFDKNLYYRLSLLTIPVPPLRNRREDIPEFVDHFMMQMDKDMRFHPNHAAIAFLTKQDWPGNIRELRNVVARGAVFHPGCCVGIDRMRALTRMGQPHRRITKHVDQHLAEHDVMQSPFDLKAHLHNEEARFLRHALDLCDGVVTRAANMSGLRRTTFIEKMRRHGIRSLQKQ
jgi:sigma-54 dependent transcriptional regulator, flagellar regulatory protein